MTKEIPLTRGKVALVDDEDYERLSQFHWYAQKIHNVYYGGRHTHLPQPRGVIYIHREIMVPPPGFMIDHIDGNGLNNQKSNLRIVTNRENLQNYHVKKASKFPGVMKTNRKKNPWQSKIQVNKKIQHLGVFPTEEAAYEAYKNAVKEFTGKILGE